MEPSDPAPRRPELSGILKLPGGLFEPKSPQPTKTLRFCAESEHFEVSAGTLQSDRSGEASSGGAICGTRLSETSEDSKNSVSMTRSQIASGARSADQPHLSAVSDAHSKDKLSSRFSRSFSYYLAALTGGGHGRQDKDKSSQSTVMSRQDSAESSLDRAKNTYRGVKKGRKKTKRRQNQERRHSRSHRRRTNAVSKCTAWSPCEEDARWREALSRYALLSMLVVVALLFMVVAMLQVVRSHDGHEKVFEEQEATVPDGQEHRSPRRRALGTNSLYHDDLPYTVYNTENEADPERLPFSQTGMEPTEVFTTSGDTTSTGEDDGAEDDRVALEATKTARTWVPV